MSAAMLEGRKILITGPAGQIAFPMARALARRNEVWGIARFSDPASRKEVEEAGIRTLAIDLGRPDFAELPRDFTHLLHLAAAIQGDDYDGAIRTNAEGTGLLLSHCRGVEAALVMSTVSVYKPHPDPWHLLPRGRPARRHHAALRPVLQHQQDRRGGRRPFLRARVRDPDHDRAHGRVLRSARRAPDLLAAGAGGRESGRDPLRSLSLQPDPRRRHPRCT